MQSFVNNMIYIDKNATARGFKAKPGVWDFFISNESNGTLVSETRTFDRCCLFLLLSTEKFD